MAVPRVDTNFFHTHVHGQHSVLDAINQPKLIVDKAERHGQPACSLTDHGTMAGCVQMYLECMKRNMKPYLGFEGYLIDPEYNGDWENPTKGTTVGRYHFGLLALNEVGYKALVRFISKTHTRPRFNRFARCTLSDLLELGKHWGDDIVLTTGCYFGLIQQLIVQRRHGTAHRYLEMLKDAFPNLFVEVQHHNIEHEPTAFDAGEGVTLVDTLTDDAIVETLMDWAEELDLPVIAAQDSHYVDHRLKPAHTLMKKMVYASAEDGFPGDSFHLASAEWVAEHYTQPQWDVIEDGFDELIELWDLHIQPLDNYKIHVPTISDTPDEDLREAVEEGLQTYLDANPDLDEQPYWDRADYELGVIKQLGMADYHLIWDDGVQWCREEQIAVEARGSANGSLVCFAIGITQTDPIKWGGLFERYLSTDRTKPPDIDLDIEDEARMRFVNYLLEKYGAVQIGTYAQLGSTIDRETGEERGSVLQTWLTSKRRECEELAKKQDEKRKAAGRNGVGDIKKYAAGIFARTYGDVKSVTDVEKFSPDEYRALRQMIELNSIYKSYGTHAGGVLLSGDDLKIEDYIPTMLVASSNTRVTMYDMDDVEAFGLLKMDVLGQSSLRMMKLCQMNIEEAGYATPFENYTDFTWIPLDDPAACKLLREGRTDTGIFHYEGYTKAKGGKELGIKSTEDAIMGQALFMPGAMDDKGGTVKSQKDLYIERRKSAAARKAVTYISPHFEKALSRTYGTVIFQEQIIEVMRYLELDIATINLFFKVVKDSGKGAVERNRERMASVRTAFDTACKKHNVPADEAWDLLAGFASYGFNRAHASGYGIRSYRTGYMKAHYPREYMAAILQTWAGREKETRYIREARRVGIRLLPASVNVSRALWTQDVDRESVIRKGLLSVPGIGEKSAQVIASAQPFDSVIDLIDKVKEIDGRALTGGAKYKDEGVMSGSLGKLYEAGALDELIQGMME